MDEVFALVGLHSPVVAEKKYRKDLEEVILFKRAVEPWLPRGWLFSLKLSRGDNPDHNVLYFNSSFCILNFEFCILNSLHTLSCTPSSHFHADSSLLLSLPIWAEPFLKNQQRLLLSRLREIFSDYGKHLCTA
jgi:hypothetical protein